MEIQLKEIRLLNFKCFQDLTIPLLPRLTDCPDYQKMYSNLIVLVAKNGEGKTTILEAISYLLGSIIARFPGLSCPNLKDSDIKQKISITSSGRLKISVEDYCFIQAKANTSTMGEIIWDRMKKQDSSREINGTIPTRYILAQINRFTDSIKDCRSTSDDSTELIPVIAYYDTQRAVLKKKPERLRYVQSVFSSYDGYKDALVGSLNYKHLIEWMYYIENEDRKEREISGSWDYHSIAQQTISLAISKLLPGYANLHMVSKPLDLAIDYYDEYGQIIKMDRVDSQLSDGFKTVLVLVLDIVSRIIMLNSDIPDITPEQLLQTSGVVLIDEIDLHLHPSWQQHILQDLIKAFPNIQFIVSTHSPQVVSGIPKECLRIFANKELQTIENQTQGTETDTILASVFDTEASIQNLEIVKDYNKLLQMLAEETFGEEWDALYQKLEKHYGPDSPQLVAVQLQIEYLKKRKSLKR